MVHGNRAFSLMFHLKYWHFTYENIQLIYNILVMYLKMCIFTKFEFIAHMKLLIAHVLFLTAQRSLLIAQKIASLLWMLRPYKHLLQTWSKGG